jgi:NitT/TauT family transport system permease protein
MPTETTVAESAEVSGLDNLELAPKSDKGTLGKRIWKSTWPKLLAVAMVLLLWQVVVWSGWKPEYVLPGPRTVFGDLKDVITTGDFWDGVRLTLIRALTGFGLAVLIGTIVGAAVSRFAPLRAAIGSLITGLQTMPSIMWFPLAILLFQISESAILFVVVIGAAPSVANGLISGIDYVPRTWLRVGQVLGMKGLAKYRHLILPA